MMMNNKPSFAGHFGGHQNALVQYWTHHLIEEVQGFTRKPLDAAIGQEFAPIEIIRVFSFCSSSICQKRAPVILD
jgi:hypothetical protein